MSEARSRVGKPVGTWGVPNKGVLRNMPIYMLPEDALHDSLNVLVRDGDLRVRPGMTTFNSTTLQNRVMGAFNTAVIASGAFQADTFQNDAFQMGAGTSIQLIVGTTRKIWAYFNGVFNDITDTPLTGTDIQHVRMSGLEISNALWTLITNGQDSPRKWNGSDPTVSVAGGTPPAFTDITTIGDRIIGIVPPYKVRWGQALNLDSWPSSNVRVLSDTPDLLVAIRNLGTLGGAVYKNRSIWTVSATGTTDATFFRMDLRSLVAGPSSPAALVEADGSHYYMTPKGRVGMYDGASHRWVADGSWRIVREDIDQDNANRTFAVYEPTFREVFFFYPRKGDGGEIRGCLIVCLPRPAEGIGDHISFPARLESFVSAGTDLRQANEGALVFSASSFLAFNLTEDGPTDEGGQPISGFWQTGLVATPASEPHRVEGIETFAERGGGYGSVSLMPVTSYLLDTQSGDVGAATPLSLETTESVYDPKGVDARGRFLGVRYSFPAFVTLRWKGAIMDARALGVKQQPG